MAMKKCRECGHSVSSSAKTCPSCGVKNPYISPYKGIFILAVLGWATWSVFFDDKSTDSKNSSAASTSDAVLQIAQPVNLEPSETSPFNPPIVCKAAMAAIFSQDINTLKVARDNPDGVFKISYRRASDGNQFSYDCKLSGNYVIWKESGQMSNRWSGSGYVDNNLKFAIDNKVLVITEVYGNANDPVYRFGKGKSR